MSTRKKAPKPLVVIHPDAYVPEMRDLLDAAGYAVLVTPKPELVRVIEVSTVIASGSADAMIYRAAVEVIRTDSYDHVRAKFAKLLSQYVIESLTRKPAEPADG